MLKLEVNKGVMNLTMSGDIDEISADVLASLTEMHRCVSKSHGKEVADSFIDGIKDLMNYVKDPQKLHEDAMNIAEKITDAMVNEEIDKIDSMIKELKQMKERLKND